MLDHYSVHVHNNQQVAALPQLDRGSDYESERHRFESYTPHHLNLKPPSTGAFLLWKRPMDSNLGRGASVKRTRSVRSERASAPAGGRSRCGSGNRKPPVTGAFLLWRHSTPEARLESCAAVRGRLFLIDSCKIPSRCRGPSATTPSFND